MTYPPHGPPQPGEPLPPAVDPYQQHPHTQPLYEQPDFGQPPPMPPTTVQPPGYGHPGYPQQGYGQPGYPMPAPHPRPASTESRAVAITLLSVAIALVVLIGGGAVFYLVGTKVSDGDGNRTAQGGGASASPSASPSPSPSARADIRIKEPKTLNGHAKIKAKELESLTTDLEKEVEGYPGANNAFGAVYGDLSDKVMIAVLAAEVDVDDPQRMLDTLFQSFSGESQLIGVTPASTGSLGGVAQCGSAVIGSEDVAICGWSDEGSIGMILYFYETAVDVKGDFPGMREEIETKK